MIPYEIASSQKALLAMTMMDIGCTCTTLVIASALLNAKPRLSGIPHEGGIQEWDNLIYAKIAPSSRGKRRDDKAMILNAGIQHKEVTRP
jgi:hypothetical protein